MQLKLWKNLSLLVTYYPSLMGSHPVAGSSHDYC